MAIFLIKNPHEQLPEVYFEHKLPDKYKKYSNICGPIIKLRNILIFLTFIEIGASIWGFSYYFVRRVIKQIFILVYYLYSN